jgi:CRISPR-associated protein Csm4
VFRQIPSAKLLDVTPNPAPAQEVKVWEYLYAFPLGVKVEEDRLPEVRV